LKRREIKLALRPHRFDHPFGPEEPRPPLRDTEQDHRVHRKGRETGKRQTDGAVLPSGTEHDLGDV
jgi:hypothetical protein